MVKIKWLDRVPVLQDDGTWQSDNKSFEGVLNQVATPAQIRRYVPNIDEELINLAREHYPNLEVLEGPEPIEDEVEPGEDIPY